MPLLSPAGFATDFQATQIHRARIDVEEMRSGKPSPLPKDLPFREAVEDPDTRAIYIRRKFPSMNFKLLRAQSVFRFANSPVVDRGIHQCHHPVN
jgi:hypothetical protein